MARKYGICFVVVVVCCLIAAGCGSGRSSSATATSASPSTDTPAGTPTTPTTPSTPTTPVNSTLTPPVSSPVVYVYEDTPTQIEAFTLNVNSGALTPIPGSPFSINLAAGNGMALAPNAGFAYVLAPNYPVGNGVGVGSNLLVYALDPVSGAPTSKQTLALTTPTNEAVASGTGISVHPSGQFIYLSPYRDNSGNTGVGIFSVQSDGCQGRSKSRPLWRSKSEPVELAVA